MLLNVFTYSACLFVDLDLYNMTLLALCHKKSCIGKPSSLLSSSNDANNYLLLLY